jgi:Predicted membrane protein
MTDSKLVRRRPHMPLWRRLLAHAWTFRWTVDRLLPEEALDRLEKAVAAAEQGSSGQIRLVIESSWPLYLVGRMQPRGRALQWFSELRVWDTEQNNGVLIYLCFAEHDVEILADRGFNGKVTHATWEAICRDMEQHFRVQDFELGLNQGLAAIGGLLRQHFPSETALNELPNRPYVA